jgi:hypothetical protein
VCGNIKEMNGNTKPTCFYPKYYYCKICQYKSSHKNDFTKHLSTVKHIKNEHLDKCFHDFQKPTQYIPGNSDDFACENCCKKYKTNSGLWKHKKTCQKLNSPPAFAVNVESIDNKDSIILSLLNQNKELQNQILELCKDRNNVIINNNNSNNKTFNLHLFLNEQCKDAMNIMDFVDSLKLQLVDLENVGKLGFIEGISNIIVKNLKAMDIHKRPVHCSDAKRETLYVKDENKWEKENDEKIKIKKAIKYVANKNIKMIPEWKEKYPDCVYSDSMKSDEYNKIIIESMGGVGDNNEMSDSKIIKKIAKEVIIEKMNEKNE